MKDSGLTRRAFLAAVTTTAAVSAWSAPNTARVVPRKISPNEKVNVAGIGVGGKGSSDILSFLSPLFTESRRFKGRIRAELCVRSDREDTCFYIRLSVVKNGVAYSLRDDIMSLRLSSPDYHPGEEAVLCFSCAPLSFRIEEGERLRLDVSSSDFPHYSVHTNRPGLQADMAEAICSNNTVICGKSAIFLPFE